MDSFASAPCRDLLPLLAILGPTASGKSALSLDVAEALDGEIISADAFAVYRGMDIGTDKPSFAARQRFPHHMVDVEDPANRYSAGRWARAAATAVNEVAARGRIPMVVGGSLFYFECLMLGLFPSPSRDPETFARLSETWERDPRLLRDRLESLDPEAAAMIGSNDRQRILRALEHIERSGEAISKGWARHGRQPRFNALIVAPQRSRNALYVKIETRVDRMFSSDFVEEVKHLLGIGTPPEAHALKAIGYKQVVRFLHEQCELGAALEDTKRSSRRLAKRQLAWLNRRHCGAVHGVKPAEHGGAERVITLWNRHSEECRSQ